MREKSRQTVFVTVMIGLMLFAPVAVQARSVGRNNFALQLLAALIITKGFDVGTFSPFFDGGNRIFLPIDNNAFNINPRSHLGGGGPLDPPRPGGAFGFGFSNRPIFADLSGNRIPTTLARSGSICGKDKYGTFCNEALAKKAGVDTEVERRLDARLGQFLRQTGTSFAQYQRNLQRIQSAGGVPDDLKAWYQGYLNFNRPTQLDIKSLIKQMKANLKEALSQQPFNTSLLQQYQTIDDAIIKDVPDVNDPVEMRHFLMTCGASNRTNNAYTCPFHNQPPVRVFICGGREEAAMVRGNDNLALAMADVGGTIDHEGGHLIGIEPTSPASEPLGDVSMCLAKDGHERFGEYNKEKAADLMADMTLALNIEKGETLGLSPEDYLIRSMARLCGTGGDHPPDYERIEQLMNVIKSRPLAREKVHCNANEGVAATCLPSDRNRLNF